MTKLVYLNYLKDKNFNIDEEYKKIFLSSFQLTYTTEEKVKSKMKPIVRVRDEFKNNNKNIFDDKQNKILEEIFITFKEKKIDEFDIIFKEKNLEDILISETNEILNLISNIGNKRNLKKLKYFFNYDKFQDEITKFFKANFNFRSCFYCNKDYIVNFEDGKNVSTFQLDHFYDKAKYPYLALSFYNLIPSCYVCNAKVKGTKNTFEFDKKIGKFKNETCLSPNDINFDFENKVKFKLLLDKKCKNLHIKEKEDIDVPLKEQFSNEYDKYIEIFKLNERYKAHKDIVYEMITKAELYPESRLKELQNLTGIPFQQIKKDIFNLSDEKDLSKKPFSKLIKDMSEELGLI